MANKVAAEAVICFCQLKNQQTAPSLKKGKVASEATAQEDGRVVIDKPKRVNATMMKNDHIHNRKYLKSFRKDLRNSGTSAEAFLWKHLQKRRLKGRKFRRQHSIKDFIVDFYCPAEQLIIELDGEVHKNPTAEEKDSNRDKALEKLGFTVLRFENKMVFDFLPSVLKEIEDNFKP